MKMPRSKIRFQRFYSNVKRRIAKKFVSKCGLSWRKLVLACDLKEGDIIHTCHGYNEVIKEIESIAHFTKNGWVIYDLDIILENGGSCSLQHCCTLPSPSKQDQLSMWKRWAEPEYPEWDFGDQHKMLIEAIRNGKDPFEENGCIKNEFLIKR